MHVKYVYFHFESVLYISLRNPNAVWNNFWDRKLLRHLMSKYNDFPKKMYFFE